MQGGLIYAGTSYAGCPTKCVERAISRSQALSCVDMDIEAPLAGWVDFFNQRLEYFEYYGYTQTNGDYERALRDGGCGNLTLSASLFEGATDYCADSYDPQNDMYTSVASFCPVTCGCANNGTSPGGGGYGYGYGYGGYGGGASAPATERCPSSCT